MAEPHDVPTMAEMVEAIREWLERDVMTSGEARLRFHGRVAANMLAMVERELELGPSHAAAHAARLAALGVHDDRQLASAIRDGSLDDRLDEVRAAVRASVIAKLEVANPRYLTSS
jgi:hypothetical protein